MSPSDLVTALIAKGAIDADDVLKLRREVYADGIIDPVEAKDVFELERACESTEPAWLEFFVNELTYFFVFKAEPRGYVSEENGEFLIDQIVKDGRITGPTELELLLEIVHSARSCPEWLVVFVLEAVKESVLSPENAVYGADRQAGVIDSVDVEIIRRVIYAGGGGGSYAVTRREADLLWDLNKATLEAANADGWRDLFVNAIASHLMFPLGPPEVPDAEEVLAREEEREAWLQHRPSPWHFLALGRSALRRGAFREAWREVDPFGTRRRREEAESEQAQLREAMGRESIDESEATWLIDRVNEDDVLDENERSLLTFIKQDSPQIHPALQELLARTGV